jgi:hypothetical protein
MLVELYYWNYLGDRGPQILYPRVARWPALAQKLLAAMINK